MLYTKKTDKNTRPEKHIDWDIVDEMLLAGCLGTEIAPRFDINQHTFYDRVQKKFGITFTQYSQEKRAQGEGCLREVQYKKAIGGDNTLLVWLGKNRLKQSDSPVELAMAENTLIQFNKLMGQLDSLRSSNLKSDSKSDNTEDKSDCVTCDL